MDHFLAAILMILVVSLSALCLIFGQIQATGSIQHDCKRFGAFYIDDKRYSCEETK